MSRSIFLIGCKHAAALPSAGALSISVVVTGLGLDNERRRNVNDACRNKALVFTEKMMAERFIEAQAGIQFIDRKLDQIRSIADEFPSERIWQRPRPDMISLGNLICHVAGSMRDWFENGLGKGDWNRDRRREFERENGMDSRGLIQHLDETRDHCDTFLATINEQTWNETRAFRNKSYAVREIVLQQVEHVAYHAGQAAFLRRIVADLKPTP